MHNLLLPLSVLLLGACPPAPVPLAPVVKTAPVVDPPPDPLLGPAPRSRCGEDRSCKALDEELLGHSVNEMCGVGPNTFEATVVGHRARCQVVHLQGRCMVSCGLRFQDVTQDVMLSHAWLVVQEVRDRHGVETGEAHSQTEHGVDLRLTWSAAHSALGVRLPPQQPGPYWDVHLDYQTRPRP